jgi:cytochrome c oxidase assembly protein subunit 15
MILESNTLTPELSRWPHRLAWVLCCATFPLVWVGGLVTSYKAGMAFPDWPTSGGYFLFFYPWLDWLRGPWDMYVEHGHRMLAATIGLLTIAFCLSVFATRQPKWLRRLALLALAGVILQGLLGGMRVLMNERTLAMIHGCVGPALFAYTAALVVVTSRGWQQAPPMKGVKHAQGLKLMAIAIAVLAYLQIVLGAQVRHFPVEGAPALFRGVMLFHVVVGIGLALYILAAAISFLVHARSLKSCTVPVASLAALVLLQIALGAGTWIYKYNYPAFMADSQVAADFTVQALDWRQAQITTAHVANGSLILAISGVLAINSVRWLRVADNRAGHRIITSSVVGGIAARSNQPVSQSAMMEAPA